MFTLLLFAARFADATIVLHILISMISVSFAVTILIMPMRLQLMSNVVFICDLGALFVSFNFWLRVLD